MGADTLKACNESKDGQVLLLENLRFYLAEEGKGVINGEKVKATQEDIAKVRAQLT